MLDVPVLLSRKSDGDLSSMWGNAIPKAAGGSEEAIRRIVQIEDEWAKRAETLPAGNAYDDPLPEKGMLKSLGYCVGNQGLPQERRQLIIKYAVESRSLPPVQSKAYVREWGKARSDKRFRKIRAFLTTLIDRNAGNRPFAKAVSEWAEDLKFLAHLWSESSRKF
ncbi:hypothetical protein [Mesorhizobium sp. M1322]|uniref:hypothetical protein n=1 Tax=Mesorhizobium sp. M1322 TaxID=2957081 RepID=UPI003334C0BB